MKSLNLKASISLLLLFSTTLINLGCSDESITVPNKEKSIQVSLAVAADVLPENLEGWTLYVYAARPETRLPLSSYKGHLGSLPTSITLDETMFLLPGLTLKDAEQVVVIAKASQSADPHKKSNQDIIGFSEIISFADNPQQKVGLIIDRHDQTQP